MRSNQQVDPARLFDELRRALTDEFNAAPGKPARMHDSNAGPDGWQRIAADTYEVSWQNQTFVLQVELEKTRQAVAKTRLTIFSRRTDPRSSASQDTSRLTFRSTNIDPTTTEFFVRPVFTKKLATARPELTRALADTTKRPFVSGSQIVLASGSHRELLESFLIALSAVEDLKSSPPRAIAPGLLKLRVAARAGGADASVQSAVRHERMSSTDRVRKYGPNVCVFRRARTEQTPESIGHSARCII